MRQTYLAALVLTMVAAIGVPALASGEAQQQAPTALVLMADNYFYDGGSGNVDDSVVEVDPGGTVTFRSPVTALNQSQHNIDFAAGGPRPASCNQTVQSPAWPGLPLDVDGVAPMPNVTLDAGWEGVCTFSGPGR